MRPLRTLKLGHAPPAVGGRVQAEFGGRGCPGARENGRRGFQQGLTICTDLLSKGPGGLLATPRLVVAELVLDEPVGARWSRDRDRATAARPRRRSFHVFGAQEIGLLVLLAEGLLAGLLGSSAAGRKASCWAPKGTLQGVS